ncbi:MAG: class I SAM-dependent methyltransferase [Oscillospiraceae bacterium]|nr:class I SAM-dependent methyltransferase [Oscillospiraceae bacterium]
MSLIYPGHEEGRLEGEALQQTLSRLDAKRYDVLLHRLIHVPDCPYILAVERRK